MPHQSHPFYLFALILTVRRQVMNYSLCNFLQSHARPLTSRYTPHYQSIRFSSTLSLCSFPRNELHKKNKSCISQGMMLMVHVYVELMSILITWYAINFGCIFKKSSIQSCLFCGAFNVGLGFKQEEKRP
jgi:hypothetical protein